MRTRFAILCAVALTTIMVLGALSGPASAKSLPSVPNDVKVHIAQAPKNATPTVQPNVLLSLRVDGRLIFSSQSYKPAVDSTSRPTWAHCSFCGRLNLGKVQLDGYRVWAIKLKFGTSHDTLVYGYYSYQEYNPLTNTFVRDGAYSGSSNWDGSPLPFYKDDNGHPEALIYVGAQLYNPYKPQVPADPCGEGCGKK
jgi:hypothetical protein